MPAGDDAHLTVTVSTRAATPWAPAGHVVAADQVTLREAKRRTVPARRSRAAGDARDLLAAPVELSIFRAPVDNDGFKLMPWFAEEIGVGGMALSRWQHAGVDRLPAGDLVRHRVEQREVPGGVEFHHTVEVPDELADLPRVGVRFALPARFGRWRWYGRGPHENYPDRNRSAAVGVWDGPLDEPPYLVPQEFGLRTDCRWVELIDPRRGQVVRVDVLRPSALHASATRYSVEQLYAAANADELRAEQQVWVHLDVAHRGLGTASCGPDVLPQYRLPAGTFRFAYRLSVG